MRRKGMTMRADEGVRGSNKAPTKTKMMMKEDTKSDGDSDGDGVKQVSMCDGACCIGCMKGAAGAGGSGAGKARRHIPSYYCCLSRVSIKRVKRGIKGEQGRARESKGRQNFDRAEGCNIKKQTRNAEAHPDLT
jgi:hypothetical protein